MKIGPLRHLVDIQRLETTKGEYGESQETWVDVATKIWAQISPTGSREFFEAQATFGETTYKIVMRQRPITNDQRIVHQGATYNVRGVQPSNDGTMVTVIATTGVTDGAG